MPRNIKHSFRRAHTKLLHDKDARLPESRYRTRLDPLLSSEISCVPGAQGLRGTRGAAACLLTGCCLCGCTEQQRAARPQGHFGISEFIFCLSAREYAGHIVKVGTLSRLRRFARLQSNKTHLYLHIYIYTFFF